MTLFPQIYALFFLFCRNKRLCAFQKVRQTNLQPKCSKRGGWGRGHVFLTMLKKAELAGDGIHPLPGWGPIRIAFCRSLVLDVGEGEGSQV